MVKDRIPFRVRPMLATLVAKPFDKPGWVYEEKYDGYRILAYKQGDRVTLFSRNDKDRSLMFSGVTDAVRELPAHTLLLDGEVVAFDRHNVSRFQLLQQGNAKRRYAVFDCLYVDGKDPISVAVLPPFYPGNECPRQPTNTSLTPAGAERKFRLSDR